MANIGRSPLGLKTIGRSSPFSTSGTAPVVDPLTAVAWHSVYWAEDPSWTNPGAGGSVSSWRDGTGNSHTLTQGTGAAQPTFRTSGGSFTTPHLQFDGGDYLSTSAFTNITGETSHIAVLEITTLNGEIWNTANAAKRRTLATSATPQWGMFAGGASGANFGGTPAASTLYFIEAKYQPTPHTGYLVINGTVVLNAVDMVSVENIESLRLGANAGASSFFTGRVAFYGFYNGDIWTDPGWTSFRSWAGSYYGITIS